MSSALSQTSGGAMPAVISQAYLNKTTINYVLVLFIIVGITFVQNIPISVRLWLNSPIGGIVGLVAIVLAHNYYNWITALLLALLLVLTINAHILTQEEGFEPGLDIRFINNKKKWYIEQVLNENPIMISEDTVQTLAVQDDSGGIQGGSNL